MTNLIRKIWKSGPDSVDKPKSEHSWFMHLSLQDQILFAKRLAILMKSGVPIVECFRILKKQSRGKSVKTILDHLIKDVENGMYLSVSLSKFRKIFGEFAINIIEVGEVSGTLHDNLSYLAEELQKKQALRRKVVGAMVYPIFIVIATLAITVMLTVFLFPKILPIFASLDADLPITTKVLIFVSAMFINYGLYILIGFVLLIIGFIFLLRVPAVRIKVDHLILKLPVAGRLAQAYHMANFTRTLGILLRSEVAIVRATAITAKTTKNLVYQREFFAMAENITKGEKISTHLDRKEKLFPPMLAQMINVGEHTGNLSGSLAFLADVYEKEVDDITKNLSTILEPSLMVFMGVMVGFIAISIISPIYEITQHLNPR
jgi:type IV pilus assembly protein PilC